MNAYINSLSEEDVLSDYDSVPDDRGTETVASYFKRLGRPPISCFFMEGADITLRPANEWQQRERGPHRGFDIPVPVGTPLVVPAACKVVFSHDSAFSGGGKTMILHFKKSNIYVAFLHLNSRRYSVGTKLTPGQIFATTGNTGRSSGPHLHIEMHHGKYPNIEPKYKPSNVFDLSR